MFVFSHEQENSKQQRLKGMLGLWSKNKGEKKMTLFRENYAIIFPEPTCARKKL